MHKRFLPIAALLLALFFPHIGETKEFKARVIGITDGDTIKVLKDGNEYKIRLKGIDCPEKSQPLGKQAKLFTSRLTFNKEVLVVENGQDKYGRLIADVILSDHSSLSRDIVRAGYAWWYRQYAPKDRTLAYAEADAKLDGIGLWKMGYAQAPWEYRHKQKMHRMQRHDGFNTLSGLIPKHVIQ